MCSDKFSHSVSGFATKPCDLLFTRRDDLQPIDHAQEVELGHNHFQHPCRTLPETNMSCSFPSEILDLIVDHLHNKPNTLKTCCLVSKLWVPRTRKHLFADMEFNPHCTRRTERWMKTFPDPTSSPARHTRSLSTYLPGFFNILNVDVLLTFCRVVHLDLDTAWGWYGFDQTASLISLHGLSPVIRSLRLKFNKLKNSEVFGLICSLLLLEDLDLCSLGFDRRDEKCSTPSTSPKLTGFLKLWMYTGIQSVTRGLLALPNGIHFTKITVRFHSEEGVKSAMGLVLRCFDTLESLDMANNDDSGAWPSAQPGWYLTAACRRVLDHFARPL